MLRFLLRSLLLQGFYIVCLRAEAPSYLTALDYANAEFVDTSQPMKVLLKDQRFHAKRFRRGSVVSFETDKWPGGRVPYVLSTAYTPTQRAVLARSMAAFAAKSCIRFVPKEPTDRDYIIVWKNVIDGANADFDKISSVGLSNYGEPYDYFSILHYESTEGSKNGKNTIESKTAGYTPLMGKSTDFTRGDLNRINKAYKCFTGSTNTILRQHPTAPHF
ncbi:Metalloendopeptidase [Aphelenchoides fujianensis]|nr:Metalloendopeptidase [Aphelenchoides fujianensis]